MPVYKRISIEELNLWLSDLKLLLLRVYRYPTKSSVLYLVVSLYEYVQVMAKLSILGVSEAENIKITVKDIKDYIGNTEGLLAITNKFKSLRDDASHGYMSDSKFMDYVTNFLCTDDFILLINSLNLDKDLTKALDMVLKRLKVCFTEEYKRNCMKECKEMLKVIEGGSSLYSISSVVSTLKYKYDIGLIHECIISVLGDDYVV